MEKVCDANPIFSHATPLFYNRESMQGLRSVADPDNLKPEYENCKLLVKGRLEKIVEEDYSKFLVKNDEDYVDEDEMLDLEEQAIIDEENQPVGNGRFGDLEMKGREEVQNRS
mmetsp:Transcript_34799/g.34964  ORF Transcript_34799/g.34964 Transcript_34799/m.34964 type:complete len:113 (-) Transcript_34799:174-512(-)